MGESGLSKTQVADLLAENERLRANQRADDCVWKLNSDGVYETQCERMWWFDDGGVKENEVNFCIGCGGKVKDASPVGAL
jgi:hypothetical protein